MGLVIGPGREVKEGGQDDSSFGGLEIWREGETGDTQPCGFSIHFQCSCGFGEVTQQCPKQEAQGRDGIMENTDI